MDCVFCAIGSGAIGASKRYEDDDLLAFDDLHPKAPTHVLVVPRRHIPSVRELTDADAALVGRLVLAARAIAERVGIAEGGYKLIVNCGRDGGQVIPHLHVHLLGGKPLQGMV